MEALRRDVKWELGRGNQSVPSRPNARPAPTSRLQARAPPGVDARREPRSHLVRGLDANSQDSTPLREQGRWKPSPASGQRADLADGRPLPGAGLRLNSQPARFDALSGNSPKYPPSPSGSSSSNCPAEVFGRRGLPRTPPRLQAAGRSVSQQPRFPPTDDGTRPRSQMFPQADDGTRPRSQPLSQERDSLLEEVFEGRCLPRTPPRMPSPSRALPCSGISLPRTPPRLQSPQPSHGLSSGGSTPSKVNRISPVPSPSNKVVSSPSNKVETQFDKTRPRPHRGINSFGSELAAQIDQTPDCRRFREHGPPSAAKFESDEYGAVASPFTSGSQCSSAASRPPRGHAHLLPAACLSRSSTATTVSTAPLAAEPNLSPAQLASDALARGAAQLADVPGAVEAGWREYMDPSGGRGMVYVNDVTYEEAATLTKVVDKMRKMEERKAAGIQSTGMHYGEVQGGQMNLVLCAFCGRRFNPHSIQRHEQVCREKANKPTMRL